MAGTITALRLQKRNKDRVNVYLDGKFAFGLAVVEAIRLEVGQMLSDDVIARLQIRDKVEQTYERALNFLSYRPRSEDEVRRNLRRKDVDEIVVEEVIERLTRVDLLNDREFARYWVENRLQFNPRGLRGLRHELRQKGLAADVITDTLADLDIEAAARQAAETGARRLVGLEARDFRRKLQAYLTRRGFSYAVIAPLIEELLEEKGCEEMSNMDIESEEKEHERVSD
jgi:regulatory protein